MISYLEPYDLRCEQGVDPLGVDVLAPRLSWKLRSAVGCRKQAAWQVIAATSLHSLHSGQPDCWDSGRSDPCRMSRCVYSGRPLESRQRIYWAVRVWNEQNETSPFSPPASWEMGLLAPQDFIGQWIGGEGVMHRKFILSTQPAAARAYFCALGYGELYLNGKKVGADVLDPAQTDYEKLVFYRIHDVTNSLRTGENVVSIMLGEGFFAQSAVLKDYGWPEAPYGEPRVLLQLEVTDLAEKRIVISTDNEWRRAPSPIIKNNIYAGEHYDARLESQTADVEKLLPVKILPPPGGVLRWQPIEPIRVIREIHPQRTWVAAPGVRVFDLGQNFAGWARISASAPRDTELTLRFAEEVDGQGRLDTASTGVFATKVEQVDRYIFKGEGVESWRPRFSYHGFRYVEAQGLPASHMTLCGEHVRSNVRRVGHFQSSDPRLNRLYEMAIQTLESNLHSILTDCPIRERCGWLGDAQLVAEFAIFNFDLSRFWAKVMDDIFTSAGEGGITMVAPGQRKCGPATPAWGSACILLPWLLYVYYGDCRCMSTHYEGMKNWLRHLEANSEEGIISWGLGDWCSPGTVHPTQTPVALTSTGYFYNCLRLMSRMAAILGQSDDSYGYKERSLEIRNAFNRRFFDEHGSTYGSQTGNAFALHLGLVQPGAVAAVAAEMARDVREVHANHHTTGIIGTRYLLSQLTRYGYGDVAMSLLHQDTYPSFGYWINQGATTFWETWEANPADEPMPRSRNHPMQAGFAAWFHQCAGGIRFDETFPASSQIRIEPQLLPGVEWVEVSYASSVGLIHTALRRHQGRIVLDMAVPANVTAIMRLPRKKLLHRAMPVDGPQLPVAACQQAASGDWEVTDGCAKFEADDATTPN